MEEMIANAANMQQEQECAAELQQADNVKAEMWYKHINFEDAKAFIKTNIVSAARSFIAIGYYLKHIRDGELFREDDHESIWEFAMAEYGISKSTASRYMSMNDRFSQGGNSPLIDSQYKGFDKSKLQEMLSLTDEQLEQVTPEMRVQDIRSMRMPREIPYFELPGQLDLETDFPEVLPEPAEQTRPEAQTFMLNVADLAGDEEPEKPTEPVQVIAISQQTQADAIEQKAETIAMVATGQETQRQPEMEYTTRKKYCDAVARKLIESKSDLLKADYANRAMLSDELEKWLKTQLLNGIASTWYFPDPYNDGVAHVNFFQDYIQFWNGHHGGWVGDCEWCYLYESIQSMWNEATLESLTDLQIAREELERENNLLRKCLLAVPDEDDICIRRMKIKVAALESFVFDLDDIENPLPKPEQPELPILRNNDQRKEWLENFRSWPVWFEAPEASEVYYRYDLPDGSSLVICEYHYWADWVERYGHNENPDRIGEREYLLKSGYHYLHDCRSNRSVLIEKLKEIQKKG